MNFTRNPLRKYFKNNKKNLIHKWDHYFDIYHRHFKKFRSKKVVVVELGVSHGGSLQMWKRYFGRKARIIGVDINPECRNFEERQIEIHIGSQEDEVFLRELADEIGDIDILIDDGGHTMKQQNTTFKVLYGRVKVGGVYLVEDTHTSYWGEFGGGLHKPTTFTERSKGLVDQLNAWHARDNSKLVVDNFTRTTRGIHFYDSVVVFEKENVPPPFHEQSGGQTLSVLEEWEYRKKNKED